VWDTVEPMLAVASTYRTRTRNVGGSGGVALDMRIFRPPKWVEIPETFKSNEAAWEEIDEAESFVRTGDPVREVLREAEPQFASATEPLELEAGEQSERQE
jgi:hypothetical protein